MPLSNMDVIYDSENEPILSDYYLRKWSRYARIRDRKICKLCDNLCPTNYSQAHHIFPKAVYPQLAYQLWNSICLCTACHLGVIHSSPENESRMRVLFWAYMQSNEVTDFNTTYQYKLTEGIWVDCDLMEALRLSPAWITS